MSTLPEVKITSIEIIDISKLTPHPKNPNKHSREQIERLAEILKYQGFRYPVKVSKRSGFVTSGHGRIEAAKLNGWASVPVSYQDYDSEEQEYADIVSDNAIASWAELDLSAINMNLPELGPDFDLDMLGIKNFTLDVELYEAEKNNLNQEFKVEVLCANGQEMTELVNELSERGMIAKAIFNG